MTMNTSICRTLVVAVVAACSAAPAFGARLNEDGANSVPTLAPAVLHETDTAIPADSETFGRAPFMHLFEPGSGASVEKAPALVLDSVEHTQAPAAAVPPEPEHSGWGALLKSTASDFGAYPRRKSTWVILSVGAGAALMAHAGDDYVNEHIVGSHKADHVFVAGKWIGSTYVQFGTAVGLYLVGRYAMAPAPDGTRTNKVSHLGFDLIRAQILAQALVQGIKYTGRRDRPTGECCAFPSGHAATAFAAASVIERHFGYRGAWPTLVTASYVATSRLVDNRHFLSDVVFGSAVGLTSGWTVVGRHGRSNFALVPTPVRGGVLLAFTAVPAR